MMGNIGPVTALVGRPGVDYGPHWSLIIGEIGDDYEVIEPNNPYASMVWRKQLVLASNSFVDGYKFERYWTKNDFTSHKTVPTGGVDFYDLGGKERQKLANCLVAVVAR
jgi:hypothetical protein